jgi:hypothetical protein
MTIPASEVVAATEAQQSASILRKLRLSVFLASLPFGLPLSARELGASPLTIGVAKLTPQGGRIMRYFDLERGTAGLNKFQILAVGTRWRYHEKAPSCRAKSRTTRVLHRMC